MNQALSLRNLLWFLRSEWEKQELHYKWSLRIGITHFKICVGQRLRGKQPKSGTKSNESSTWAVGGCFASTAMGRVDPFCLCAYMCWCDAHTSLYQLLDFAFCVFSGSGVDHPSDCSSWLQRLGLAKSKVEWNSSPGPDKAPSFHCPDAVNSAGGEPLLFFVWLHLGTSTPLN